MRDDPVPAIVLVCALLVTALAAVAVVDTVITGRELRAASRRLRDIPVDPPAPMHTEN